ncbi:OB-fold protein [Puia dinghuensis]|uniref:tRNA_anti-like n=1 Tax=Puia dinghuensis TaxID=1792502 RepID=A0A8J2UG56_9BACT|nr:hypothetical protein [Puia dinghuensis]GGB12647.1 hypothetical protein GCM10011511_40350 [Puia dinghuensis]
MRKKYIMVALLGVLLSAVAGWAFYLYNKPHRNVAGVRAVAEIDAAGLYAAYKQDETGADRKFVGKVIEVKGTIITVQLTDSTANVRLGAAGTDGAVSCDFLVGKGTKPDLPSKGSAVVIKGRCTGFLEDVNLVDCVVE